MTVEQSIPQDKRLCGCGCGELTDKYDKKGRERFYVRGHENRGRKISEESRLKLSQFHKGRKASAETKLKISRVQKGKNLSEETKKKISEAHKGKSKPWLKGRKPTQETLLKRSRALKGKKRSDETRKKLSKAQKGKSMPTLRGRKRSAEEISKTVLGLKRHYDHWPFEKAIEEARKIAKEKGLKTAKDWRVYWRSERPEHLPCHPEKVYKGKFKGHRDWLWTGVPVVGGGWRDWIPFEELRRRVISAGVKTSSGYQEYRKTQPDGYNMPQDPARTYEEKWQGWYHFLGIEDNDRPWDTPKVKELLKALIDGKILYHVTDAEKLRVLQIKGVLNLGGTSRYDHFFKNLVPAVHMERGRKLVEDYKNSDSAEPPDLSMLTTTTEKIGTATPDDIADSLERQGEEGTGHKDPLDYKDGDSIVRTSSPRDIFDQAMTLDSIIGDDREAMQFLIRRRIHALWKEVLEDGNKIVAEIRAEPENSNKFHDTVLKTFLAEYDGADQLPIPDGYAFKVRNEETGEMIKMLPTLMQKYIAFKIKTEPYFANFSGTGSGKTLSAVLASRAIDSKITLVVCPLGVVGQWEKHIKRIYPDSIVFTEKQDVLSAKYDENKHQYLILNYDKFSQDDTAELISNIVSNIGNKINFIVLDETHFIKRRYETDEKASLRHMNLAWLLKEVRDRTNKAVKVIGLTATPVINNLREGKSLLELITGKEYKDLVTKATVANAVMLFEKLSLISIREMPDYKIDINKEFADVTVDMSKVAPAKLDEIRRHPRNPLKLEQLFIDARLPEIVKRISEQTIIYTEYLTGIIQKIRDALAAKLISYAEYTGETDDSGLTEFLKKRVQVLIASRPLATGVDELQHVCNNLIINTLPWTNAGWQQLVGRLVRKGQIRDWVNVHIIRATMTNYPNIKKVRTETGKTEEQYREEYPYDHEIKWARIEYKRTVADCAVEGVIPEKNLVSGEQAHAGAIVWLDRLNNGQISSITRRDLDVRLAHIPMQEIERRERTYGDLTAITGRINHEHSSTTHQRFLEHPEEWEEMHRLRRIQKATWSIDPCKEVINRIHAISNNLVIADFGCGEAEILDEFGPDRVRSFDHISRDKAHVKQCDMVATGLENECIDVAVFSQSLMGSNWTDYLTEAHRVLFRNGIVMIANSTNALKEDGRLATLRDELQQSHGFEIYRDVQAGGFTFIEARKL